MTTWRDVDDIYTEELNKRLAVVQSDVAPDENYRRCANEAADATRRRVGDRIWTRYRQELAGRRRDDATVSRRDRKLVALYPLAEAWGGGEGSVQRARGLAHRGRIEDVEL